MRPLALVAFFGACLTVLLITFGTSARTSATIRDAQRGGLIINVNSD